ncbi:MAG: hypothetical protein DMD54_10800 [Gemmatimonadetes bacterium]|nr:MAG: hypothetical protein DMD54_10800 [Gemmatimonadota bacterium]
MRRWVSRAREAKILRARELRRKLTIAERKAWEILRDRRMLGFKFRRQHIIHGFIVDFYCHELKLVLEIDGKGHASPDRVQYDAARTQRLEMSGLQIVRLRNREVGKETLRDLVQSLAHRSPSPRSGGARG